MIPTDPPWSTAVHEAAHAVVARALGRGVVRVSIEADADSHGHVRMTPFPDGFDPALAYYDARVRRRVEDQIMIACAGGITQGRVDPEEFDVLWGSQSDYDNAHDLALWASSGDGDEAAAYVEWLRLRTSQIVWNPIWWAGHGVEGR